MPSDVDKTELTVESHIPTDNFSIPDDVSHLVSGVYQIESEEIELHKNAYLDIEHCSELKNPSEICVIQKSSAGRGGKFEITPAEQVDKSNRSYTRIIVEKLTTKWYAIVRRLKGGYDAYYGILYRSKKETWILKRFEFNLIVVRALTLIKEVNC